MSGIFELMNDHEQEAVIKVVGVGGGGGNAVEHMVREKLQGVEFLTINTDAQALRNSSADSTLQIGGEITKGLGAGANPEVGRDAALEDKDAIRELLNGADMVFIAAGMGGGTGTGAAPVVAQIAKELGILTVAVVTKPFSFEGKKRLNYAQQGINELAKHVDSLITIPNDKLLKVLGRGISLLDAFREANNVLLGAVQGIAELITRPGLINVDFADVRTVMREMGTAMMGTGTATGEDRAEEAEEALAEAAAEHAADTAELEQRLATAREALAAAEDKVAALTATLATTESRLATAEQAHAALETALSAAERARTEAEKTAADATTRAERAEAARIEAEAAAELAEQARIRAEDARDAAVADRDSARAAGSSTGAFAGILTVLAVLAALGGLLHQLFLGHIQFPGR